MKIKNSNRLAIASFIIGLLSFLFSCFYGGVVGILSLILGIVALSRGENRGFSITGIIFSSLALIISLLSLTFVLFYRMNTDDNSNTLANESNVSDNITTIEETVLCDQNGIKITALKLEKNCIKVKIENNSEKNITAESVTAVNGCMMYSPKLYYSGIASGNSANGEIPLDNLDKYGIEIIGNIKIAFKIHEERESYSSLWFETDITELKTNQYDNYTSYSPNGKEVFNDTFSVHFIAIENTHLGKSITIYVKNPTTKNFVFSCENLAINNLTLSSFFSYGQEEIFAGCGSIIEVPVQNSSLEENDITEIENIDLGAYTYDTIDQQSLTEIQQIKFSAN